MASTVWKGYISFGLVSVPVRLFAAARDEHISFHMIHKECGTRVKQQLYCPYDQRVVERSELTKGFPLDKNRNVLVDDKELKALAPESSEVMEIQQFVQLDDLDPVFFETSYYSVPEEAGKRAYALLFKAMEEKRVVAVAKITMHQRERIVAIRPYDKGLTLHTLYYADEVREVAEYGQDTQAQVNDKELQLAEQFIASLTSDFDARAYKDTYEERVMQLIESKGEGKQAPAPIDKPDLAPVIDLMEALKRSVARKEAGAAPQRVAAAPKAEPETAKERKKPAKKVSAQEERARTTRTRKAS